MVRTPYDPLFHEPKKNTLLSSGIATVKNRNGIAEAKIVLNLNMAMLANKTLYDKSNHQYFIVAEAENTHIDKTLNTNAKETVAPARPTTPARPAAPARPATPKKEEGTSIFDTIEIAIKNILAWDPFEADTTNKKVVVEVSDEVKKEENENNNTDCFCNKDLTEQVLKDVGVTAKKAKEFLEAINKTFSDYEINTCLRKIHFLSQVIHESGGFRYTSELKVADTAYKGYKGRGLIQITGKTNYTLYGKYENVDFTSSLENKIKLEKLPYSARSAGWFWKENAKLNDDADKNDFINITRIINGGYNGYDDRLKYLNKGFDKIYNKCINDKGKTSLYDFTKSKSYNDKRGSFAWGLWHDPDLNKDGCTKDKQKAIDGYTRFIELAGDSFDATNWYNISVMNGFVNLRYLIKKNKYVKVIDAAKQRLKKLKT